MHCGLPISRIPQQYYVRAAMARVLALDSITEGDDVVASRIALAELVQITCFVALAVLYSLAFFGYISPLVVGIIALSLLPIQALSSFNSFVLYPSASRYLLTAAAMLTLALYAGFAVVSGRVTDGTLFLSGGGVALHLFRNITEWYDSKKAMDEEEYIKKMKIQKSAS